MAGIAITLTVEDGGLALALKGLGEFAGDLRPLMKRIGDDMVQSTERRFDTGTSPDGAQWPISKAARDGKSKRTLVRSGNLSRSFAAQITAAADGVEWGTIVPYASPHQFGADIVFNSRRRTIETLYGDFDAGLVLSLPARPFVGISDLDQGMIEDAVLDEMELAAKAGTPARSAAP